MIHKSMICVIAATFAVALFASEVRAGRCRCTIEIETLAVPTNGSFALNGTDGSVFLFSAQIADLTSLNVELSLTDAGAGLRDGTVVSASGQTAAFVCGSDSVGQTTWTLGGTTGGCNNQVQIDTTIINGDANVTGCFVLDAAGGLSQSGVRVDVAGSVIVPGGGTSALVGSSTDFDLTQINYPCPTASQWGVLAMSCAVLTAAGLGIRRRTRARAVA